MTDVNKQINILKTQNRWRDIINLLKDEVVPGGKWWDDHWLLSSLGFAYSQLKEYDRALYCYQRWVEIRPHTPQPYYAIGYVHYDQKNWDEALEWFDKALELQPDYPVVSYRCGVASFSDRKAKVAVDYLLAGVKNYQVNGDEDYLRRNGKYYFKSIFYLGKCYHVLRDYGKARRCFEKVLADDTRHYVEEVYVRYNLARTELESGNSEAARKLAIEALQLQEKHPDAWLVDFLGRVYFSQQRYDQAIEQYNRAIKLRAQSYILFNRARAWYRKGDTARAIEDLNAALQRDRKGKHKTLLELGKIVLEQGKLEDARVYFERAIEFKRKIYDSDYAEAHLALAEYYRKTGDEAHAAQEVKTAESLRPELEFDDQLLKSTRIIL